VSGRLSDYRTVDRLTISNPFTQYASKRRLFIETENISTDYSGDYSAIYVNEKFASTVRVKGEDTGYGFRQYDNLSELLIGIAKSLGCFVYTTFTGLYEVEVKFAARWANTVSGFCYIKDYSQGSIDVSSVINDKENKYYGNNNAYAIDGFDKMPHPKTESDAFKARKAEIETEKERDIESAKLLLTTSQTAVVTEFGIEGIPKLSYVPLGIIESSSLTPEAEGTGWREYSFITEDHLQTAIFVYSDSNGLINPAVKAVLEFGNETVTYDTLTDYINDVSAKAEQYYESEYSLTVPFWNGFSNGSNYGWDKVQLGSRIQIAERQRYYDETEVDPEDRWKEQTVTNIYKVTEIERSLSQPETKLKMIKEGDKAFAVFTGTKPGETPFANEGFGELSELAIDAKLYQAGETIEAGDVVQVYADGKIYIAKAQSAYYGRTIGVALDDGDLDDMVPVQTDGIVYDEDLSFDIGSPVFYIGGVTQDVSTISPAGDDMIVFLGIADTERTFIMRIREVIVE
jgi:hypothetical protein